MSMLKSGGAAHVSNFLKCNKTLYKEFQSVMLAPNLSVVGALSELVPEKERDNLVSALLPFFEHHGQIIRLFKKISKKEVPRQSVANSLFRGTSLTGKLMSRYGSFAGKTFIRELLHKTVTQVSELPYSLELDDCKLDPYGNLQANQIEFSKVCKMLLENILASMITLPPIFRHICRELQLIVTHYFHDKKYLLPSSFLFILFICPALVSPLSYGVVDEPISRQGLRSLILISKVVLAVATGVTFGSKEPFMTPFNPLVNLYRPKFEAYYDHVLEAVRLKAEEMRVVTNITEEVLIENLTYIFHCIHSNMTKLGQAMGVLPSLPDDI